MGAWTTSTWTARASKRGGGTRPGPVADATPLVLLHEGLGSVSTWRDFPAALAGRTGRPCSPTAVAAMAAPTPRGSGLSVDFMHREAAEVVPRVLDAAGIERAVLFGHSDGGSIALLAAARWPDRVAALALEAPHVFVEDLSVASIAAIRERYLADGVLRARLAAAPRARRRGVLRAGATSGSVA